MYPKNVNGSIVMILRIPTLAIRKKLFYLVAISNRSSFAIEKKHVVYKIILFILNYVVGSIMYFTHSSLPKK